MPQILCTVNRNRVALLLRRNQQERVSQSTQEHASTNRTVPRAGLAGCGGGRDSPSPSPSPSTPCGAGVLCMIIAVSDLVDISMRAEISAKRAPAILTCDAPLVVTLRPQRQPIPVEHIHSSHNDTPPNGVSHYEDVVMVDARNIPPMRKAPYCPPDDSAPIFTPTFGNLDKICLRAWFPPPAVKVEN